MRVRLSSGRITLVTAPLDLRCGFPRLSAICQNLLGINLLLGRDIVIFISENRQFVKIVGADNEGTWLINRRLHQGRFQQLLSRTANSATEPLSVKELERYLDGEDIQVKRQGLLKN